METALKKKTLLFIKSCNFLLSFYFCGYDYIAKLTISTISL